MNERKSTKRPTGAETLFPSPGEQEPGKRGTWEESVTPRGWALRWDGLALTEIRERRGGRDPSSTAAKS